MKKKVDLFIVGNLIVSSRAEQSRAEQSRAEQSSYKPYLEGRFITSCDSVEEANEYFDTSDAILIIGDLEIQNFDARNKTIVVVGCIAEGGCNG